MSPLPADAQRVLDFWFGPAGAPDHGRSRAVWWRKDPVFDAEVTSRFGHLVEAALAGGLRDWQSDAGPALARVLLLDQFTRNMFRNTPRAFAGDPLALDAARTMVTAGHDLQLAPQARAFAYMPFEHAEDLAAQDEAVRRFGALEAAAPEVQDMLDYALRHRAIIERFGRFPHRNAILGRASTPEEIAFLQQPGSSF